VETLWREKPLRGSQTHEIYYSEDKVSYKAVALTYPYAMVVPWTLMCNPTRTPSNQVTYLKGSLMESFTLGPTPKIDFNFSTATTHNDNGLRVSRLAQQLLKYTLYTLRITCLWASIYRLQKTKSESDTIFLGSIQTDNYATSFPNSLNIPS